MSSDAAPASLDRADTITLDDDDQDTRPINLQTDTHILTCFKARRPSYALATLGSPPYFLLVDKRRPDKPVQPEPLTLNHVVDVIINGTLPNDDEDTDSEHDDDDKGTKQKEDHEEEVDHNGDDGKVDQESSETNDRLQVLKSNIISVEVKLAGNPIGEIKGQDQIDQLNEFISQWREQLAYVNELSIIEASLKNNKDNNLGLRSGGSVVDIYGHRGSLISMAEVESLAREMHKVSVGELRDRQLIAERRKFLQPKNIIIRAITWNVHGERISGQNLTDLLGVNYVNKAEEDGKEDNLADIFVISLQESDQLGKNLYANTATLASTTECVLSYLPKDEYVEIAHNQLLGLMTIIIVRNSLVPQVSSIELASTGTGLFGVWGNKGAIVVRFVLGSDPVVTDSGTQIVVVNCHLSAGSGVPSIDRRRWELSEISSKFSIDGIVTKNNDSVIFDSDAHELSFSEEFLNEHLSEAVDNKINDYSDPSSESSSPRKFSGPIGTSDENIVILLGDLNFRVSLEPADVVQDFANRRDYDTILIHDTLTQEIKNKRVLQGFKEGIINFPPTYRYSTSSSKSDNNNINNNIGSSNFGYDLDRIPSYTDRILYACDESIGTQLHYTSHQRYNISDHKPVSSTLRVKVHLVDYEKRNQIVTKTLKKLDKAENAARPVITVDPLELTQSGSVLHEQKIYTTITHNLSSTSRLVEWEVIINENSATVSNGDSRTTLPKLIIKAFPERGLLPPGASQKLCLSTTLPVSKTTTSLRQVIIIRIQDVQDIFVSVEFNSLPTCLGASLDLLCHMPQGARNGIKDSTVSSNMPREICNCVDYLWNHINDDTKDLIFWSAGDEAIENQVQEWMDNGQDFDIQVLDMANEFEQNIGVFSVANQFILLLKYLDGGIIPVEYYHLVLRGASGVNPLLENLSGVNVNVLLYITGFLSIAIGGGVNEEKLLQLFEPLLISTPRGRISSKSRALHKEFLKRIMTPGED